MKARWYCGHYIGSPYWQTSEIYEADECGREFDEEVDEREWQQGLSCTTCPKCGAFLDQHYDKPILLK